METAELLAPEVTEVESQESTQSTVTSPDQQRQADKDYSAWIKTLREDGDAAKYHRQTKDNWGRLQELRRLEPKGLDGIRSTYENVKGVTYGDKTGLDAIPAMREALAGHQASLEAIQGGDFESLPEGETFVRWSDSHGSGNGRFAGGVQSGRLYGADVASFCGCAEK